MPEHAEQSSEIRDTAGATGRPPEDRSSRRWIRRRIEQLDPVQDYAEIVKLGTAFYLSQFTNDWIFALSMPRFNIGPSATAISRGGAGKLFTKSDRRYADTTDHFLVWVQYGPESPQVKRSVDIINALHARWAKEYPEEFNDPDLWTYVIAWEICGTSAIFSERLGLPEPSEKEKIAKVVFGKKLAELFVYVDGRPLTEVMRTLDTYEDWVAFLHEYESRPRPYDEDNAACLNQVLDTYKERSPLPFRPFARALVTTFWHDGMFRCGGIEPPGRFMRWAARNFMKTAITVGGMMPDPKESFTEKILREDAEKIEPLSPIMKAAQVSPEESTARCPMGFGGGDVVSAEKAGTGEAAAG